MTLQNLLNKCEKRVIGLMSGTSADGIDAALVKIKGCGPETKLEITAFDCFPFSREQKQKILSVAGAGKYAIDELSQLNFYLGYLFADAAISIAKKAGLSVSDIDLIGSHGQTVRHVPEPGHFIDRRISSSLQLGEPSVIANTTGVTTIGDFRPADMAVGGQGAPLVPLFDYLLFRSEKVTRAVLNIGGIANLTLLPKSCTPEQVIAFDTGPGNMIVDNLCKTMFNRDFDKNGSLADSGTINYSLVDRLLQDDYFSQPPPKSTGRERFGADYLNKIIDLGCVDNLSPVDLIATMTFFSAKIISTAVERFYPQPIEEFIVSGGGVNNFILMRHLQELMPEIRFSTTNQHGIPPDAKEAVCFAVLANETLHGHPGNIPSATGANRPVVLGKICLPGF